LSLPDVTFQDVCERHGLLVGLLMTALRIGSSPVAWVMTRVAGEGALWRLDLAQLVLLAFPMCMMGLTTPSWLPYVAWPVLRLFDLEFIYMRSFVYNLPPASKPRAVVHLFLHYTEVIVLFAMLYLFMQSHAPHGPDQPMLFAKNTDGSNELTAPQAVFFSFITGATIGYGDIAPNHSAARNWVVGVYFLTWLKTLMILSFTLVELNRIVGFVSSDQNGDRA